MLLYDGGALGLGVFLLYLVVIIHESGVRDTRGDKS